MPTRRLIDNSLPAKRVVENERWRSGNNYFHANPPWCDPAIVGELRIRQRDTRDTGKDSAWAWNVAIANSLAPRRDRMSPLGLPPLTREPAATGTAGL